MAAAAAKAAQDARLEKLEAEGGEPEPEPEPETVRPLAPRRAPSP